MTNLKEHPLLETRDVSEEANNSVRRGSLVVVSTVTFLEEFVLASWLVIQGRRVSLACLKRSVQALYCRRFRVRRSLVALEGLFGVVT